MSNVDTTSKTAADAWADVDRELRILKSPYGAALVVAALQRAVRAEIAAMAMMIEENRRDEDKPT